MLDEKAYLNLGLKPQQLAYLNYYINDSTHFKLGRIVFHSHDLFLVSLFESRKQVWSKLKGSVEESVFVGDWVVVFDDGLDHQYFQIHYLLPRFGHIKRSAQETLMVNVDRLALVTSFNDDFNQRRLERAVYMAEQSGVQAFIVMNKSDLLEDEERNQFIKDLNYRFPGLDVVQTSTLTGHGIQSIKDKILPGETLSLLGMSGVGKSSLINCILGQNQLETQDIRESDSRGRHTTTGRHLFWVDEKFWLMDTPGIRSFSLSDSKNEFEDSIFSDMAQLIQSCRFSDCRHESEPGCQIQWAIQNNQLDLDRWRNYLKIQKEVERQELKNNKAYQASQKQKWKQISKSIKKIKY